MKIAVDIDNTICERVHWTQLKFAKAIPSAIEKINKLYDEGNTIIYYTGRYQEDFEMTKQWLLENGAKYNSLVMGKLIADLYIDNDSKRICEL